MSFLLIKQDSLPAPTEEIHPSHCKHDQKSMPKAFEGPKWGIYYWSPVKWTHCVHKSAFKIFVFMHIDSIVLSLNQEASFWVKSFLQRPVKVLKARDYLVFITKFDICMMPHKASGTKRENRKNAKEWGVCHTVFWAEYGRYTHECSHLLWLPVSSSSQQTSGWSRE